MGAFCASVCVSVQFLFHASCNSPCQWVKGGIEISPHFGFQKGLQAWNLARTERIAYSHIRCNNSYLYKLSPARLFWPVPIIYILRNLGAFLKSTHKEVSQDVFEFVQESVCLFRAKCTEDWQRATEACVHIHLKHLWWFGSFFSFKQNSSAVLPIIEQLEKVEEDDMPVGSSKPPRTYNAAPVVHQLPKQCVQDDERVEMVG